MRSFSNYRKQCIRESLNRFTASGSSKALFDILKLDLLEHTDLPALLTENVIAKTEFNLFRNECKARNDNIVATVCDYAGDHFYDVLMAEADLATSTAVDPAAAFRMLRDEVRQKIIDMVAQLKSDITGAVASPMVSRDDEEDPTVQSSGGPSPAGPAGGGSGPASGGPSPAGPAGGGSGPASGGPSPAGPAGGGMGGGPSSSGHTGPTVGGAWRDMKAALRPKDGWLGGIKRSLWNPIRDAGRYLKKNWYGENRRLIESMLSEQGDEIGAVIDNFQKELLRWFDTRCVEIARNANIDLGAAGVPTSPNAAGTTPNSATPEDPNGMLGARPVGPETQDIPPNRSSVEDLKQQEEKAEQGDPVAEKKVKVRNLDIMAALEDIKEVNPNVVKVIEKYKLEGIPTKGHIKVTPETLSGKKGTKANKKIQHPIIDHIARQLLAKIPDAAQDPKLSHIHYILNHSTKDRYEVLFWIYGQLQRPIPSGKKGIEQLLDLLINYGSHIRSGAGPTAAPGAGPAASDPTAAPGAGPAASDPTAAPGAGPAASDPTAAPEAGPAASGPAAAPEAGPEMLGVRPIPNEVPETKKHYLANFATDEFEKLKNTEPAVSKVLDDKSRGKKWAYEQFKKSLENGVDPTLKDDDVYDMIMFPAIVKAIKAYNENPPMPQEDPIAQDAAPPEMTGQDPAAVPQEDPAAVPQEDPAAVPQEDPAAVPQEDPAAVPQEDPEQDIPVQPEARPAKLSSMSDMVKNIKSNKDPETQLRSYGEKLDHMIKNTDVEYIADDLMAAWKELNPTAGKDEFSHLKNQLAQAVNSPDAESAIKGFKKDLLISKMKQLGITPKETPVGESYKAKIDKYRKLIKESAIVSPTKKLREKLGLPA